MLYKNYLKRVLDILLAALLLIFTSPILIITIISISISNCSLNVFFRQRRPGLFGELFTLIKFKTMRDIYNDDGSLLPDSARTTQLGKILRKTSIDELPQLVNVIKGDMSLIGPRPLLPEYLPHYSVDQKRRHDVRPGISGWAQINGRNNSSFVERFEKDIWYVDNLSFFLDLKILLITLYKVIRPLDVMSDDPNNFSDQIEKDK